MNRFEWKSEGLLKALYASNELIGTIHPFIHDQINAEDELNWLEKGMFSWVRHFKVRTPVSNVRLVMEFSIPRQMTYGMIPAISYNGNSWGPGLDIKGFTQEGQPWTFAYHRTAVAGGTYSEYRDWSVALFAKEGFKGACALVPSTQQTIHRLVLPEIETPQVYSYRDEYSPPYDTALSLEAGMTVSVTAYLLVTPVQEPRQAWRTMLDTAWQQHQYSHNPRHSNEEIWRWGIKYARESLWAEEGMFRGFSIGLQWRKETWKQRTPGLYEIGWCGQNASLANALLFDYLHTGSQSSLDRGLAVLDCWATYAPLSNGLFRCHFDRILAAPESPQEIQDSCNLGAAAIYFFEAYQLSKQCGVERPLYQDIALKICNFFVAHQFQDGNLGRAVEFSSGTTIDLKYVEEVYKYYRSLYNLNIQVDMIGVETDLTKYDVVIAPVLYMVKPGYAQRLEEFVRNGGTFLTAFFSGIVNETDLVTLGGYPGELRSLLGIWVEEIDPLFPDQTNRIVMRQELGSLKGEYSCNLLCDLLHTEGAEVIAEYGADFYQGMPVVTRNNFGKGQAWYIASSPDQEFLKELMSFLTSSHQIEPLLDTPQGVEVSQRTKDGQSFLFIMNHNAKTETINLGRIQGVDLITTERASGVQEISPRGVMIVAYS